MTGKHSWLSCFRICLGSGIACLEPCIYLRVQYLVNWQLKITIKGHSLGCSMELKLFLTLEYMGGIAPSV